MTNDEHPELDDLREEIDKIDLRMLDALAEHIRERSRVVEKIGAYKRKAGLSITDPKREEEVARDRVTRGKSRGLSGEMVRKIWESIIRDAKERE
jgi:chorismate mutase